MPPNTFINAELNSGECVRFINFPKKVWVGNYDYASLAKYIIIGTDTLNIDKKPLLYYNNETQVWEKPILRQWDSIEKHSDGKYYYHQRSGEKVLDGSDSYGYYMASTQPSDTSLLNIYVSRALTDAINSSPIITNKFTNSTEIKKGNIYTGGNNNLHFIIEASTLSTQDAQGFKQWLQTNNLTVVYQLAEEKVYECTNIDLITYANETNYVVNSGAIAPKTTLKVMSNISNTVRELQRKVSTLESYIQYVMIDALNNALNE